MLRWTFLLGLVVTISAHALDTFRFGNRLVEVGDSATKLIEVAGTPAFKEMIESSRGGREGERWQYSQDGNTVTFVIKDSKIASIEQTRN